MSTCTRCDAALRSGARFCTRCGARIVAPAAPVPVTAPVPAPAPIPVTAPAPAPAVAVQHGTWVLVGAPPGGSSAGPEVGVAVEEAVVEAVEESTPDPVPQPESLPAPEVPPLVKGRRYTVPAVRSHAATAAFALGLAPLLVSLLGNAIAARLTADAAVQAAAGATTGAWTAVFVALALVFVINAALLTMCVIAAGRGLRETANGITRGRGLAIAGLVGGAINLVLWLVGLVVTLGTLSAALG